MKSTSTKSTTFSRLFLALLFAALFLLPAKAEAVRLEAVDLGYFTIDIPTNMYASYDEDTDHVIFSSNDGKFELEISPFAYDDDFDPQVALAESLDELVADDYDTFLADVDGLPFIGTILNANEDGVMTGFLVDVNSNCAFYMFLVSHPEDFETLFDILASIRFK